LASERRQRGDTASFRIGVDVGGTFTDFTLVDSEGGITLWKEETDPEDPTRGIVAGLVAVGEALGTTTEALLGSISLFVHGSTIATNTVIQRNGPLVGLLCTKGYRDILYFRDGFKPERFNIHLRRPPDFVDRHLRLGVEERIDGHGNVLTALDTKAVRQAAARFREAGVAAVAVAFLWSIVNSANERRAAEILSEELPGVHVLCSADVLPEIREWERTSATVLSAYVLPRVDLYLRRLEQFLEESGLRRAPLIMQNNGGCASVAEILRQPVNMLASGPAASPAAAAEHTRELGLDDLIIADMGGTSFDVCVVRRGRPTMSRIMRVESQPVGVPGVEVHSIGAGGGSVAWVDSGGALRVGPRSAGARPGPACYGFGGAEPTVTDANVVLGYLEPRAFLGGRRVLRDDLARAAIARHVAEPLGIDVLRAAAGIVEVVNANMIGGIRAISVERGLDPRRYVLVAAGGAGGLHAARLARQLRMDQVLIPREASTFCAFGMTVTDVRHDYARPFHMLSTDINLSELDRLFAEFEGEARKRLRNESFADDEIEIDRSVDARYLNQVHELTVPVPSVARLTEHDLRLVEATFHREHEEQFTYARSNLPVEFLHWRITAIGHGPIRSQPRMREAGVSDGQEATRALVGEREAYFEEVAGLRSTPVYALDRLVAGARLQGPAIVEATTTTVVVNPGDLLVAHGEGTLLVKIQQAQREDGAPLARVAEQ
jgi:N-methylhydantoinase A